MLLLLASPLVMGRSYLPLIRPLAAHFHVFTLEAPGSGRSSVLRRPWTLEDYARWTARLMEQLRLERVILVGHSNTGPVAMRLAILHPERVEKLVLVGIIGARLKRSIPRVAGGRLMDSLYEWDLNMRMWWHAAYNVLRHPRTFLHQVMVGSLTELLSWAPQVRVPVLLAWGRRDHTMPLSCMDRLREHMPRAQVYVSDRSHNWLITHPREFTQAVLAFAGSGAGQQE